MGAKQTKGTIYSYHVQKKFGDDYWVAWWPASGFGQYCINQKQAIKEYQKCVHENPTDEFQLIRQPAVCANGNVVGVTGFPEVIET